MSTDSAPPYLPTPVVRFAPSPTGLFHVGSARTALFNWMLARKEGGTFLLRIEDTDASRNTDESEESILSSMELLGLDFDGEVYRSSEHKEDHLAAADSLVKYGAAYHCDCSRDAIDARGVNVGSGYDSFCRNRGLSSGAVRLAVDPGDIVFDDMVLGENRTRAEVFGDFPLVRSDGSPLFLLGNVVDDAVQGVTLVVRGADHVSNNPKYLLIWNALRASGFIEIPPPEFAHLPLILSKETGKKLSKRRDRVAVGDYIDEGILPGVLMTYLAGLGWGPPDGMDKLPVSDLVPFFDIKDVGVTPAVLDEVKLRALNGQALGHLAEDLPSFRATVEPFLPSEWPSLPDEVLFELSSRITLLTQAPAFLAPLVSEVPVEENAEGKWLTRNASAPALLERFISDFENASWDTASLHALAEVVASDFELGMMKATMPVRVAVLRTDKGLPLFSSLAAMDRDVVLERMGESLAKLNELTPEVAESPKVRINPSRDTEGFSRS